MKTVFSIPATADYVRYSVTLIKIYYQCQGTCTGKNECKQKYKQKSMFLSNKRILGDKGA